MEAKEVRIGNLVLFKGKSETVYQIRDSGCDFLIGKSKTKTLTQSFVWSAIEGIPLSEEWLLKFGFNYGATTNNRFIVFRIGATSESYIYCNQVKEGLDCGICIDEFDETDLSTPVGHVKYVHQLQNLYFALTGEELTISQ